MIISRVLNRNISRAETDSFFDCVKKQEFQGYHRLPTLAITYTSVIIIPVSNYRTWEKGEAPYQRRNLMLFTIFYTLNRIYRT